MINLSFLEQYGPMGTGVKGKLKQLQNNCSPNFYYDNSAGYLSSKDTEGLPNIGKIPSVVVATPKDLQGNAIREEVHYIPSFKTCRIESSIMGVEACFSDGQENGYAESDIGGSIGLPTKMNISISSFREQDPCNDGDSNLIGLYSKTVAVSVLVRNPNNVDIEFDDQNGDALPSSSSGQANANGVTEYTVWVYFGVNKIIVADSIVK